MTPELLLLFITTFFFLSMTPGPNMLLALSFGMSHGLSGAAWAGMGMCAGLAALALLSAFGVGALLAASPLAFQLFKWIGVAYLAWLGLQAIRAPLPPGGPEADVPGTAAIRTPAGSNAALLGRGVLVTLSNPKALVFMAAFFPQFIVPARPLAPQLAVLIIAMLAIEFGWIMTYAAGGHRLARRLSGPRAARWLNWTTGLLLLTAGALLAAADLAVQGA